MMLRRIAIGVVPVLILLLHCSSYGRQQMKRVMIGDDGFMMPEVGCVISQESTGIKIQDVMPPDMRPKEYADVDFREGDIVLMVNGMKPKGAKELKEFYEKAAVGTEFKFGVLRAGEKHIIAFKKADPATLPKRKIMTFDTNTGDGHPLPGIGMISMDSGKIVLKIRFPEEEILLQEKDIIHDLNGKKVSTIDEVAGIYERIPVGGDVTFGITRNGKTKVIKMKRPESQGQVIIHK